MKITGIFLVSLLLLACGHPSNSSEEAKEKNQPSESQEYQLSSSSDSVAKMCYQSMSECTDKMESKAHLKSYSCMREDNQKHQEHVFCLVQL